MNRPLLWLALAACSAFATHRALAAAFPPGIRPADGPAPGEAPAPDPGTTPAPTPEPQPAPAPSPRPGPRTLTWADPAPGSAIDPDTGLPTRVVDRVRGYELVLVKAGAYERGFGQGDRAALGGRRLHLDTRHEVPAHPVEVTQPFYLGRTEVTQGQWCAVMGGNPSRNDVGDGYPVENVHLDGVREFLAETGYRLPTEAEWELACRADPVPALYADDTPERTVSAVAWHGGNSGHHTKPVATREPNALGLYDLLGNVSELCSDYWYDAMYVECAELGAKDPRGPERGHAWVVRGASFAQPFELCRPSYRHATGGGHDATQGFRLARNP